MAEIRLTEGSIHFQEEWLTADAIKARIKEKMDAGDMKFADLAAALEELNQAMENARRIEVRIVLTQEDYERLQQRGGEDDNESVRKAILAFIAGAEKSPPTMEMEAPEPPAAETAEKAKRPEQAEPEPVEVAATIPCSKCKKPVKVPSNDRPLELECEFCGTSIVLEGEKEEERLDAGEKDRGPVKNIRHQDHFIG
ncbi:MAG: hypothetical protein K9L59_05920 [Desulfobacterales bacterium]|nr:hypothetical protein [Desulfobacterales bacterium]